MNTFQQSWKNTQTHYLTVLQNPWYKEVVEIQNVISWSTHDFFQKEGKKALHLPVTTNAVSSPMGLGSDSKPVKINLCGIETFLADSMQFMLEYGCRLSTQGCYYLMPSFRGESADETHLCQFYHSESEIPGTLDDVISLIERYLRCMTFTVLEQCGGIFKNKSKGNSHLIQLITASNGFPRITFDEAVTHLKSDSRYIKHYPEGYRVITRAGEQKLITDLGGFVWLTHPDHLAVPFYQAFADETKNTALAADLLFGLGEIVGSGQRHLGHNALIDALKLHDIDPTPYEWYVTLHKDYPMRTSGFGLGTERYICWLLDHSDIRDCQLLPRFNGIEVVP